MIQTLPSALDHEIAVRGGLEPAIAALAADESGLLPQLLARQAALDEAADPALRVRRLRLKAQDLETRAQPLWREASDDSGLAAGRRLRGETALAEIFERRAMATEALAADMEAEAFGLRLEAARLDAEQARRLDLVMALQAMAA